MGCDYEIEIHVLYGSVWVPILFFGTKTGCGGWPLCKAVFKAKEVHNVDGNYGRHQAICSRYDNRIDIMRFYISNAKPKVSLAEQPAPKRKKVAETTSAGVVKVRVNFSCAC